MEKHWSDYWKGKEQNSFSMSSEDESMQALNKIWIKFIKGIESKSNILDLGTGGGALLRVCLSNQINNHSYIGADYAELHLGDLISSYNDIQIFEKTRIESLPIESCTVDIAISQYAIEYSNLEASFKELSRVLKPCGHFMFICHYHCSEIIKKNSKIKMAVDKVISASGLIEIVNDFFNVLDNQPNNTGQLKEIQYKLKRELSNLQHDFPNEINDINAPLFIESTFSQNSISARQHIIELYTEEMCNYEKRLLSLQNAALSQEDLVFLGEIAQTSNFILEPLEVVKHNDSVFGMLVKGRLKG